MKLGYARVSTTHQNLEFQLDALRDAGCEKIFQEKISGSKKERPELVKLLEHIRNGDEVIIYKLDRLGRSLKDLIYLVNLIKKKGATLHSIKDNIDTSTATGNLIFHIFGSLAEFERELIRERTQAGLTAARTRGRVGGRPKGLTKEAQQKMTIAKTLYQERKLTIKEICIQLGISKTTFYNYIKKK